MTKLLDVPTNHIYSMTGIANWIYPEKKTAMARTIQGGIGSLHFLIMQNIYEIIWYYNVVYSFGSVFCRTKIFFFTETHQSTSYYV